ncbi:TetR/AcrR family transcriptional regulator [Seohaeicola zhoushanensis]|uniref:HTH tetR-type domain-containing protein n=1 Tax=Seohaeicola zhoushanensis TaxID=1569283 RepID=A0A8J3H290_9RHOB|nr:TetR/AcrR family transcriptional regulator [Seohaeicola zhoushanensis]GHF66959.1 hypothetical protein GCM10017056_42700 [Seohaeicola zhoushanensis]
MKKKPSLTNSIKQDLDDIKRKSILDEARTQFFESGYETTSLESIAEALGVSRQFIYSRFSNKTELLVELCRIGASAADRAVNYNETLNDTPPERLKRVVSYFVEIQIENQVEVSLFFREANSLPKEVADEMNSSKLRFHRMLCGILAEGKNQGYFWFEDTSITASAVGGMASWAFFWFQPEGQLSAHLVAEQISKIALRAVDKSN